MLRPPNEGCPGWLFGLIPSSIFHAAILPADDGLEGSLPAEAGLEHGLLAEPGLKEILPAEAGRILPAEPGLEGDLPAEAGREGGQTGEVGLPREVGPPPAEAGLPAEAGVPAEAGLVDNRTGTSCNDLLEFLEHSTFSGGAASPSEMGTKSDSGAPPGPFGVDITLGAAGGVSCPGSPAGGSLTRSAGRLGN